jgi:hypothetical protein
MDVHLATISIAVLDAGSGMKLARGPGGTITREAKVLSADF